MSEQQQAQQQQQQAQQQPATQQPAQPLVTFNTTAPQVPAYQPAQFAQPAAPQPVMQMPAAPQPVMQQPAAPQAPMPANANQQIIEQQRQQIEALQAQNSALNAQVISFINNGAQLPQQQPAQPAAQQQQQTPMQAYLNNPQQAEFPNVYEPFNPTSLAANADFSLEGLASEIGRKDG